MTKYRLKFILLITIFVTTNCTPMVSKLTYIDFGAEKTVKSNLDLVKHYSNRIDIKSEFIELGVIIVESLYEPDIKEVRILAAEKGADGFIKEGKNFVLIKILNKNPKEVINQNSKEVINVYEYKKTL